MCKVHELEIENTEGQSACLIRKKDMVISRFKQHRTLCDEIIRKQKILLEGMYAMFDGHWKENVYVYIGASENRITKK